MWDIEEPRDAGDKYASAGVEFDVDPSSDFSMSTLKALLSSLAIS